MALGGARRPDDAAHPRLGPHAVAAEHGTARRAGGPGPAGRACRQARPPLRGAPGGRPASGVEALGAGHESAREPVVAGLAADAVERAARGPGETVTPRSGDARRLLVQRRGVTPRHGAPPSEVPTRIVTLSPMSLDETVPDVSGPYRRRILTKLLSRRRQPL